LAGRLPNVAGTGASEQNARSVASSVLGLNG